MPDPFQGDLLSDERVLWTGQPDPTRLFSAGDVFLVPFSLMWGGFVIFWEASVLGLINPSARNADPPLFMVLWGIPFLAAGPEILVHLKECTVTTLCRAGSPSKPSFESLFAFILHFTSTAFALTVSAYRKIELWIGSPGK